MVCLFLLVLFFQFLNPLFSSPFPAYCSNGKGVFRCVKKPIFCPFYYPYGLTGETLSNSMSILIEKVAGCRWHRWVPTIQHTIQLWWWHYNFPFQTIFRHRCHGRESSKVDWPLQGSRSGQGKDPHQAFFHLGRYSGCKVWWVGCSCCYFHSLLLVCS